MKQKLWLQNKFLRILLMILLTAGLCLRTQITVPAYEAAGTDLPVDIRIVINGVSETDGYTLPANPQGVYDTGLYVRDTNEGIGAVYYTITADDAGQQYKVVIKEPTEAETVSAEADTYTYAQTGDLQDWITERNEAGTVLSMSQTIQIPAEHRITICLGFTDCKGYFFCLEKQFLIQNFSEPEEPAEENMEEPAETTPTEGETDGTAEPEGNEVTEPAEGETDETAEPEGNEETVPAEGETNETAEPERNEVTEPAEGETDGTAEPERNKVTEPAEGETDGTAEPEGLGEGTSEPAEPESTEAEAVPPQPSEAAESETKENTNNSEEPGSSEPETLSPAEPFSGADPLLPEEPDPSAEPLSPEEPEPPVEPLSPEEPEPPAEPLSPEEPEPPVEPLSPEEPEPSVDTSFVPDPVPDQDPFPYTETPLTDAGDPAYSAGITTPSVSPDTPTDPVAPVSTGYWIQSNPYPMSSSDTARDTEYRTDTIPTDKTKTDITPDSPEADNSEKKTDAPADPHAESPTDSTSESDPADPSAPDSDKLTGSENTDGSSYDISALNALNGGNIQQMGNLVIIEENQDRLLEDTIRVTISRNNEMYELEKDTDYTLRLIGSSRNRKMYKYTIFANNFSADGSYRVFLYSEDESGNISTNEEKGAEIYFTVDTTSPLIISMQPSEVQTEPGTRELRIRDDADLSEVNIFVNDQQTEYVQDGEIYSFHIPEENADSQVRVVAKDSAGNICERLLPATVSVKKADLKSPSGGSPLLIPCLLGFGMTGTIAAVFITRKKHKKAAGPGHRQDSWRP